MASADRHHPVDPEPARIKRRLDLARQGDGRVETLVEPGQRMRAGLDVDVEIRLKRAEARQARHQPVGGEQRQGGQLEAHQRAVAGAALHRHRQRVERRPDLGEEAFAGIVELDRLVATLEQGMADMALEGLDSAGERRRRQSESLGRGLDRPGPRRLDERLHRRQRRQSLHLPLGLIVRCTLLSRGRSVGFPLDPACNFCTCSIFLRTCTTSVRARKRSRLSGILS
jgi:hypothetical protein